MTDPTVVREQEPRPVDERPKLARCDHCRSPLAKVVVGPGSRVELKCRHCGARTIVET